MNTLRIIGDVHGQIEPDDVVGRHPRPYLELIAGASFSIAGCVMQNVPFLGGAAHHREGLEIASVHAARLESGFGELRDDVVGCLVQSFGADAAALALVGSEECDITF